MNAITVLAPAKLNLGLEILGKRRDGYHDIATMLQTVSIFDRLTVEPALDLTLGCSTPELAESSNLALIAAQRLRVQAGTGGASLYLSKGIPATAGLGGASSDAAATLIAAQRLWRPSLSPSELASLAGGLGSDVPFFLTGGTALATGRGDQLEPLPPLVGVWFVVVVPALQIERKTATMYAALRPVDMTDGDAVHRQATRRRAGAPIDSTLLGNAFLRPLVEQYPSLQAVAASMIAAGAPFVALSGAGPSHYTILSNAREAWGFAARLRVHPGDRAQIHVCRPLAEPCRVTMT